MRAARLAAIALAATALASTVHADVERAGPEFQVNTYTTGYQTGASVAVDAGGGFVVAWQDGYFGFGGDGSGAGVFAQRFDPDGARLGPEFQVNTYTTANQLNPAVAADAAGRFVIAWDSGSYVTFGAQDGSEAGAFLQRFDATGLPLGPERQVNTFTRAQQNAPAVAADPAGDFVVVWQSGGYSFPNLVTQDGSSFGVFGQRYDGSGARVGGEFQVNAYTTDSQQSPAVATDAAGNFVVVWQSGGFLISQDGSGPGIFGRRFASDGTPLGPEFQVNTYTTGYQTGPSVAADAAGSFVVVWQSGGYFFGPPQDGSGAGVFGQRFDASGTRVGPEFQVNTYTTGFQQTPRVASDAAGNFLVAWESDQGSTGSGIFGQHFASSGERLGPEFQVNSYTSGYQQLPAVAADGAGDFVVAWTSYGQDGSSGGIFAQRLRTTATSAPVSVSGAKLVLRDAPSDPTERVVLVRSKDPAVGLGGGDGSGDDPTLTGGRVRVHSDTFDDTYELPRANWRYIGRPGDDRGYVYEDRFLLAGPIRFARVKPGELKVAGRGAQLGHALGSNPDPVRVTVQSSGLGRRHCMGFGGTSTFKPGRLYRAAGAPAAACMP